MPPSIEIIGDIDGIETVATLITQKIKKSELHGNSGIIAIFLHGNPSDAMPTQLSIQKGPDEPRP
jgi:hypothetical protein